MLARLSPFLSPGLLFDALAFYSFLPAGDCAFNLREPIAHRRQLLTLSSLEIESPAQPKGTRVRVFVSSTVFDLVDIRAELSEHLRSMGIVAVLSDDKLSEFRVQQDVNSIETCLVNLESCDEVIMVLDKRYGPPLADYDNISATHLEYRHAIKKKIPVRVFVRDRLEADYAIWRKNGRKDSPRLSWVTEKDMPLLWFLEEHSKLVKKPGKSNWFSTFTSSIDLKAAVSLHFRARILPIKLVRAIQSNTFPAFSIVHHTERAVESPLTVTVRLQLKNRGRAPAFNFKCHWEGNEHDKEREIVSPGQTVTLQRLIRPGNQREFESVVIAEYASPIGVRVRDRFRTYIRIGDEFSERLFRSGASLIERRYFRTPPVSLDVEDEESSRD